MTNADIITYIKAEILKGVDRQSITKALLSNGWNAQDIDESYRAMGTNSNGAKSSVWERAIPRTNKGFFIANLIFVFGLDLLILFSSPSLLSFWLEMLFVFIGFVIFSALENYYLSRVFLKSHSTLDGWIYALIVIRNIAMLLNFIPFIQILGMMLGMYALWVYIPLYVILVGVRYVRTKHSVQG